MADGECDSSTGERSEEDESVKDRMECEARASSVMTNSRVGPDKYGERKLIDNHCSPRPSFRSNSTLDSRVRPARQRPVPRAFTRSAS